MRISRATVDDAAALASLIGAFRDHLGAQLPADEELARYLPTALASGALEFHVAWLDERPAGYAQTRFFPSVWSVGTDAYLEDLYVYDWARRREVGRALLRHVEARAAERGVVRISLTTNQGNERAQALYRSQGWAPESHALYPGGSEVLWVRRLGT